MHAFTEVCRQRFEGVCARSGEHDLGTLGMQGTGDGRADAAGCPGYQRGLAVEAEHRALRHRFFSTASISFGVAAETALASGAMRRTSPDNTLPAPSSTKLSTPSSPIA